MVRLQMATHDAEAASRLDAAIQLEWGSAPTCQQTCPSPQQVHAEYRPERHWHNWELSHHITSLLHVIRRACAAGTQCDASAQAGSPAAIRWRPSCGVLAPPAARSVPYGALTLLI